MTSLAIAAPNARAASPVSAMPGMVRSALLDPRPLQRHRPRGASPLTSPTFWLASAIVLPVAGVMRIWRVFA